jgi:hypothetical protein
MIIVCAWCQQVLGVKAPEDDLAVSHGICRSCSERAVPLDVETGTVARAQHPGHDPRVPLHPAFGSPRTSPQH